MDLPTTLTLCVALLYYSPGVGVVWVWFVHAQSYLSHVFCFVFQADSVRPVYAQGHAGKHASARKN